MQLRNVLLGLVLRLVVKTLDFVRYVVEVNMHLPGKLDTATRTSKNIMLLERKNVAIAIAILHRSGAERENLPCCRIADQGNSMRMLSH
jgi:hypothetical protein